MIQTLNGVYPEEDSTEHPKFSTEMRMKFLFLGFMTMPGYAHFHTAELGL